MKAIEINSLGKMYKLFDKTSDRIADVFDINKFKFWDKSVKYREFWALRDINLEVNKGERIGIIGRNGAGKSTLLKIITGSINPTEGRIKVNGKIQALLQLGTGFHPEFTGLENIRTSLSYNGISKKKALELENEIIEFSELEDYINQPIKYYSAGMYSRLAFAVSTALEPDILIIDEVLGAGDAAFTTKCAERMKKLTRETGATVLFVSHSMDSVLEICDKAILLERGTIVKSGTALEVSKVYNKKIREEEELRIRAKEYKISKKDISTMVSADEYNNIFLFRFCVESEHPKFKHKIYKCRISDGNNIDIELIVGAPMDNDESNYNRILDGNQVMDWSEPKKANRGFFRYYMDKQGVNRHAPFQMAVPKHIDINNLVLEVEAEPDSREKVFVEQWINNEYKRLGEVTSGEFKHQYKFFGDLSQTKKDNDTQNEEVKPIEEAIEEIYVEQDDNNDIKVESVSIAKTYEEMKNDNSIYGSEEIIIEFVDIFDENGKSKRVFTMGEEMTFCLNMKKTGNVERFTVVIDILTKTGKVISQVFCESEDLEIKNIQNKFIIKAKYAPIRLGEDEYMVSIGIFKNCDYTSELENESYCVVDRTVFFNVKQPDNVKKSLGAFAHECQWSYGGNEVIFDAANLRGCDE
ncbi:ABC transporter ATP-binding protein [Clostridium uliginosum]|uniref:Lipopolysaccharide transport system ATP-binding protein n=1 Tax=Clostridium uliginosum TaxID=119641 RepID=A0A1I1R488_9CLOT|nr:ABC transporter ATP-binding protein [Clostridium uliginosum]SFD26383.1 lipopolysaccharide transport system ATP-binding protein [Clostridium uliginosum]